MAKQVWNMVMATYYGGDGAAITDCLTFENKDAAIDQMNWIAERNGFDYDSSDLRDPDHNQFFFYTHTGRLYMFSIIKSSVYKRAQI